MGLRRAAFVGSGRTRRRCPGSEVAGRVHCGASAGRLDDGPGVRQHGSVGDELEDVLRHLAHGLDEFALTGVAPLDALHEGLEVDVVADCHRGPFCGRGSCERASSLPAQRFRARTEVHAAWATCTLPSRSEARAIRGRDRDPPYTCSSRAPDDPTFDNATQRAYGRPRRSRASAARLTRPRAS